MADGEILAGGGLLDGGGFGRSWVFYYDTPDPAMLCTRLEGKLSADIFRQVTRVVDVLANHVTDVERTVRADYCVYRAKPLIGCGEEIAPGGGVRGSVSGAGGDERLALHEVLRGLTNKRVGPADDDTAGAGIGAGVLLAQQSGMVAGRSGVRA